MLPTQRPKPRDIRASAHAPIAEQTGVAHPPSFLYRLGRSIANGVKFIKQGFEQLFATLFQRRSATADAFTHVAEEVGRSSMSNPLNIADQDQATLPILQETVTNNRFKFQGMALTLVAPTEVVEKALGQQLFGSDDATNYIAAIKTYALCCVSNTRQYINPAHLDKAMQGVKKFIKDRGLPGPATHEMKPAHLTEMKEAGISEDLWKALVAIDKLYTIDFAIKNREVN